MPKKSRRKYTPEQKVIILKKHLVENIPVSDICDQHGLNPTVFYRWQKQFFENASMVFQPKKSKKQGKLEKKVAELEKKLIKKNEVVAELLEDHVALKKNLGET
jgi:transposase-like protein